MEEQHEFVVELEKFIGHLLMMVEVNLTIDLTKQGKIRDQVHGELLGEVRWGGGGGEGVDGERGCEMGGGGEV